jgi:hypothetical protein
MNISHDFCDVYLLFYSFCRVDTHFLSVLLFDLMRRDSNTRTGARNYRANYQHEGKRINTNNVSTTGDEPSSMELQFEEVKRMDQIDERMGFPRYQEGPARLGWLINMHPVSEIGIL